MQASRQSCSSSAQQRPPGNHLVLRLSTIPPSRINNSFLGQVKQYELTMAVKCSAVLVLVTVLVATSAAASYSLRLSPQGPLILIGEEELSRIAHICSGPVDGQAQSICMMLASSLLTYNRTVGTHLIYLFVYLERFSCSIYFRDT